MSVRTIVGIDPGGTTGLARVDASSGDLLECAEAKTTEGIRRSLVPWCSTNGFDAIVVCEDFIGGGPRNADAIMTLKLIGFCEGVSLLCSAKFVVQQPQVRRAYVEEARRRGVAQGKFERGSVHEIDAYAHALALRHKNGWDYG